MLFMLWFGTTLQLIAHMVLFKTDMPPEVIVFLSKMCDFVRFGGSDSTVDSQHLSIIFTTAGYESSRFTESMSTLMWVLLLATISIASLLVAKDAFISKSCKPRGARRIRWTSCPSAATFVAVAGFAVFFASFEMLVCALIEVKFAEKIVLAPIVLICLIAAYLYLLSRFYKFNTRYSIELWSKIQVN